MLWGLKGGIWLFGFVFWWNCNCVISVWEGLFYFNAMQAGEEELLRCRERVGEWDTKAGLFQTTWLIRHSTRKMIIETVVMPLESLEVVGDDIYIKYHLIEINGFGANIFYI